MENNRDLFKEAIADAKALKEVSIANAKAALEEVITPRLKSMFEQKLTEMEEEEEKHEEVKEMKKEDSLEEEFNLEELLAELDEVEDEEIHEEEVTEEMEATEKVEEEEIVNESEEVTEEEAHEEEIHEEEETEEEEAEEADEDKVDDSDVDIDFDNMTEDDLRAFIEEVVDEMIEAEELSLTDKEDEDEAEEAELEDEIEIEDEDEVEIEDEVEMEDEIANIELEEDAKADSTEKLDEAMITEMTTAELVAMLPQIIGGFTALVGGTVGAATWLTKAEEGKYGDKWKAFAEKLAGAGGAAKSVKEDLAEIETLRTELNEVNLLNSKLLYLNKILKEASLKESQKAKAITAFDKAETVKEVKLVYETLKENLSKSSTKEATKKLVRESKNFASSTITGTSPVNKPVMEVDPMIARMKKLAGLS